MDVVFADQLWSQFEQGCLTEAELDRLYRNLSKETHPDLNGGDGKPFIELREAYLQIKQLLRQESGARAQSGPRQGAGTTGGPAAEAQSAAAQAAESKAAAAQAQAFDPYRVICECGYSDTLDLRSALYVLLSRYYALGLYSFRMRQSGHASTRHELIRQSIRYWADLYDPSFREVFEAYDRDDHVPVTDMSYRDRIYARRCFLQCFDWFLKFQDHGRESAREIFRERAEWARMVLRRHRHDEHAGVMDRFVAWLLLEVEKPSVRLRHIR
jgi:hypothetical protein